MDVWTRGRLIFLVAWAMVCASELIAQPVTMRFQGSITSIESFGPAQFDLPPGIDVNDSVSLQITFVPVAFPDGSTTFNGFTSPGGTRLVTPATVEMLLGEQLLVDTNGSLYLQHDPFGPCSGNSCAGIDEHELISVQARGALGNGTGPSWSLSGGFAQSGSILHGGEDLGSPDTWNLLTARRIGTVFSMGTGNGNVHVVTEFGAATLVPEPNSAWLGALGVAAMIVLGRYRKLHPS